MGKNQSNIVQSLKENLGLYFAISIGIFLFVLFFQPFPISQFDFNNSLLFVGGLGGTSFLFMILIHNVLPWNVFRETRDLVNKRIISYLAGFALWLLCSVAFAFYLHFVGKVHLSFFIILKLVIIALAPSIALRIHDLLHFYKQKELSLLNKNQFLQKKLEKYQEGLQQKTIEFASDTESKGIKLFLNDIVWIKSADNYVEIYYREGSNFRKKMLRNTLKNIEVQLKNHAEFMRCHRTTIINITYVDKLFRKSNNYFLHLKEVEEQIPVSRQYIISLKESLW
ncbi:MAG: LytTR family transcriptional regulator [Bacteroidales bacterium]|nr:LytTR family transcriptional regulator [Bacteroidales bacterium]MCF8387877.1 LytTR family transcriptional regulator [Bacteroidales bacterium]MCF8398798.1 LytTR family transcriptional regulator [Bacteroidales bacterium]